MQYLFFLCFDYPRTIPPNAALRSLLKESAKTPLKRTLENVREAFLLRRPDDGVTHDGGCRSIYPNNGTAPASLEFELWPFIPFGLAGSLLKVPNIGR